MIWLHMFSSAWIPIWDMLVTQRKSKKENRGTMHWLLKLLIGCDIYYSAHISLTKTSHTLRPKKRAEMSIGRYCDSHGNE